MRYETVAGAYRDLERATGWLALIDRLAELVRQTPTSCCPPSRCSVRPMGLWVQEVADQPSSAPRCSRAAR